MLSICISEWYRPDQGPVFGPLWSDFLKNIYKNRFFESSWYQGIESSRNREISTCRDLTCEILGDRFINKLRLRAPAAHGVSSFSTKNVIVTKEVP